MFASVINLCFSLAAVGAVLIAIGWRGRRINDHPVCRRCRFDLVGQPERSTRCPECGADLTGRRAVRNGHRRMRPIMLSTGLVFALVGAGWFGLGASGVLSKVNWNHYKPTWWLAIEAGSTEAATLAPVLDELRARLERGELSEARIESLARTGIDHMETHFGDAVPVEWDQFILRAWRLHHLSDEIKLRYAPIFLQTEVFVQPATLDGQQALMLGGSLTQRRGVGDGWYRVKLLSLRLDGEAETVPDVSYDKLPGVGIRTRGLTQPLVEPIPLGAQIPALTEAVLEWRIAPGFGAFDSNHESTGVAWRTTHTFAHADFDAGRPLIELVTDDATREALVEAMFARFYAIRGEGEGKRKAAGILGFHSPPVDVQAVMTLQAGDQIIQRGSDVTATGVGSRGGQGGSSKMFTLELPDESITSLAVVLEPHWFYMPTLRRGAEGPIRVWYGRLRGPEVAVRWFDDPNDEEIPESLRDMISRMK